MKKLCLFNFYHNGDLLHSKAFVRDVIGHLGKENVLYAHNKNEKVLYDLEIPTVRLTGLSDRVKFLNSDEHNLLFINTWIGSYFDVYAGECTLRFNMKMWNDIYNHINEAFNTNIKLKSIENYYPYIDYTKYDLTNIKTFIESDSRKKILFCNGLALSGQCEYNGDMREMISSLSHDYPDKVFITTSKIDTYKQNVIHSSDITKLNDCDLNEIGYLSKFCDLIIGRNSGPFCFASTGENLEDSTKTFYAFGERETDCFTNGIKHSSKYIFEKYQDKGMLYNSIKNLVGGL